MVDENPNAPERPGRQIDHGREGAGAAFYDELLCCYICGKIYFTRRPIRLRTPGRRVFHICFECSHSLECAGCGEPVTSRTAVVVEDGYRKAVGGDIEAVGEKFPRVLDSVFLEVVAK